MKKVANFLVEIRLWLFIGSVVAVIACIVLMNFVTINKDMTKYLPKDSSMRAGLDIMNSGNDGYFIRHRFQQSCERNTLT